MSIESLRLAVTERFAALMATAHPTVPIIYDNQRFERPTSGVWIYFSINPGERTRSSLGPNPKFRNTGSIEIKCMGEADSGTKDIYEIIDTIVLGMSDANFLSTTGFVSTYGVDIFNRGVVEGWLAIISKIEYKHDNCP